MSLVDYIAAAKRFRVARGRMCYIRDLARLLSAELNSDLYRLKVKPYRQGGFSAEYPDEGPDSVDLGHWPTGQEIAAAMEELQVARSGVLKLWNELSPDEQSALQDPHRL